MKDKIIIKKFPNGIKLFLDSEITFEELLNEIAYKFSQNRMFFRDAKLAVSFEGRELSEEEERLIITTIQLNSDINVLCIVGKNDDTDRNFVKAIQKVDYQQTDNYGHFYRGTLKNNQKIEVDSSIVILGDVYPGSSVTASKDIIILGGLYGEAYAGVGTDSSHYIVALEMSPEKLKIGEFRYKPNEKSRWGIKPKVQPKIAYVKDEHIVTEPIAKDLLEHLPFYK
ncbi:MAG: septum site-determining protein MinC [Lachnospiraceae bacterium]|nr:septum site-determining protein MinC [Lachnospiraceae bacterium]